jgi:hypothetical protein
MTRQGLADTQWIRTLGLADHLLGLPGIDPMCSPMFDVPLERGSLLWVVRVAVVDGRHVALGVVQDLLDGQA